MLSFSYSLGKSKTTSGRSTTGIPRSISKVFTQVRLRLWKPSKTLVCGAICDPLLDPRFTPALCRQPALPGLRDVASAAWWSLMVLLGWDAVYGKDRSTSIGCQIL